MCLIFNNLNNNIFFSYSYKFKIIYPIKRSVLLNSLIDIIFFETVQIIILRFKCIKNSKAIILFL